MRLSFGLCLIITFAICGKAETNADSSILASAFNKALQIAEGSYLITLQDKKLMREDTIRTMAKVHFSKSSVGVNYFVNVIGGKQECSYYNHTYTWFPQEEVCVEDIGPFKITRLPLLFRPILDSSYASLILQDENNIVRLPNTQNPLSFNFSVSVPDKGEASNISYKVVISQELMIQEIQESIEFMGDVQIRKWIITEIKITNNIQDQFIKSKFIDIRDDCLVHLGKVVKDTSVETQNLIGLNLNEYLLLKSNYDTVLVDKIHTQFVLLDFWYVSCYPCIKALPQIEELKSDFIEGLSVISINTIDSVDRIEKFYRKKEIYGDVYTDILPNSITVTSYPLFLLLDSDKTIIWVSYGFSENLFDTVSCIIDPILCKNK
jgi:thiol-disulfide isomerase/thioredoxin